MLDKLKLLLGDAAAAFTDARLELALEMAEQEAAAYCGRDIDDDLRQIAVRMAVVNLNKQNAEGLAAQSYSGVNESYINGYPQEIMLLLNRKRKVKML